MTPEPLAIQGLDVDMTIHDDDNMFRGHEEHYVKVGVSALECLRDALWLARKAPREVLAVLDMPSGFGRVMRHLRAVFPEAALDACDIMEKGIAFCEERFGATAVPSAFDLSRLAFPRRYDLIWSGSFLTHLCSDDWRVVLDAFVRHLNPGGVAVFTTVGWWGRERIRRGFTYALEEARLEELTRQFDATGFGFVPYNEKRHYGVSLASRAALMSFLDAREDIEVVGFRDRGWDTHQDVTTIVKL